MKIKDLTGQYFFNWKVIKRGDNIGNKPAWICECQCQNKTIKLIRSDHLKDGHCKSCGCLNIKNDIKNQKFGKLTALYPTNKKDYNGTTIWYCKCDCGNECEVSRTNLISNHTTSCGCLWHKGIDITNKRFGKLIALYPTEKRNNKSIVWHCKCDCGNECDVSISKLNNGDTSSCGCLKSKGEEIIANILLKNNILFEQQKTFKTCYFNKTNRPAFFDFYLPNKNYIIEYDGIQHYKGGWKEDLFTIQERDNFKNQWCKDNNIQLIRIPYYHLNDLCIEDLLLQTSNFIVK